MNANISMTPELVKVLENLAEFEAEFENDSLWRCADCGAETSGPEPEPEINYDYPDPDTPRIVRYILENSLATNNDELELEFFFAASALGWSQEQISHELRNCWFPWFRE